MCPDPVIKNIYCSTANPLHGANTSWQRWNKTNNVTIWTHQTLLSDSVKCIAVIYLHENYALIYHIYGKLWYVFIFYLQSLPSFLVNVYDTSFWTERIIWKNQHITWYIKNNNCSACEICIILLFLILDIVCFAFCFYTGSLCCLSEPSDYSWCTITIKYISACYSIIA